MSNTQPSVRPAFPIHDPDGVNWIIENDYAGMTMLDYFAAAAVQSVACAIIAEKHHTTVSAEVGLANAAYAIAAAMLAEREKAGGA